MSSQGTFHPEPTKFTRRSETESIYNSCFVTLRADRYMTLEAAEQTLRGLMFAEARLSGKLRALVTASPLASV